MVLGEESNLPFYYRKLAGNIPDSKTVRNLLADLDVLGFSNVKLVMDRGFFSKDNVNGLLKDHLQTLFFRDPRYGIGTPRRSPVSRTSR